LEKNGGVDILHGEAKEGQLDRGDDGKRF
jgi:hypothetical protein